MLSTVRYITNDYKYFFDKREMWNMLWFDTVIERVYKKNGFLNFVPEISIWMFS